MGSAPVGRIFWLLARRIPPVPSPMVTRANEILAARGWQIEGVIPEEALLEPDRLRQSCDVYLLKSHTQLALSLAGILTDRGERVLNPYAACVAAQNKLVAFARLRRCGIPVPESWTTSNPQHLIPLLETGPLVVKPYEGHRGVGVRVLRTPDDLAADETWSEPVIVQRFVDGPGHDLKVYVVGQWVAAVRKRFGPLSFTKPGEPCPLSDEVRDIAERCGQEFGLGLYGLDFIESRSGPLILDVNYFPGYKGLPEAASRVARYIEDYARGVIELPAWGASRESTETNAIVTPT